MALLAAIGACILTCILFPSMFDWPRWLKNEEAIATLIAVFVFTGPFTLWIRDKSGRSWKLIIPEASRYSKLKISKGWRYLKISKGWRYFFSPHNHPFVGPLRLVGVGLLVRVVYVIPWVDWVEGDWLYWEWARGTRWFWQSGSVGPIDAFLGLDLSPSLWTFYFIPGIALLLLARNLNKLKSVDK